MTMTNHDNRSVAKDHVIVVTTYWYGPEERVSLLCGPNGYPKRFVSAEAADKYLDRYDSGPYYLAHDESSRATYEVKQIDDLEEYLAEQL
ncbi:MAG: hypothetical protein AB1781_11020 [Pseudomonadota bacterium]